MATYTQIVQRIQEYSEDDGTETQTTIPVFVSNAELRINRDIQFQNMITHATQTTGVGTYLYTKPTSCIGIRAVRIANATGYLQPIELRTLSYCKTYHKNPTVTGTPLYYANYDDDQIYIVPTPSTAVALEYEYDVRITGLSSTVATTYISTNYEDLLLYACLIELAIFEKNKPMETIYMENYNLLLAKAKEEEARARTDVNTVRRNQ